MEIFTRPKFESFDYPPTIVDLQRIEKKANDAIVSGRLFDFGNAWEELHSRMRGFSRPIHSYEAMLEACQELEFSGKRESPEANADYIWRHETAHRDEASRLHIASDIRLATLAEPKHSRFSAYLDISIVDLLYVSQNRVGKTLTNLGNILIAPELVGLGYESETERGRRMIRVAKKYFLTF